MSNPPAAPANAIAAALTRIVADGFILRFRTETLCWNTGEDDLAFIDFFEQARPALDALILSTAARINALGYHSPQSLNNLRTLSSILDGGDDTLDLARLAGEYRILERDCKLVAAIAGRDHDQDTVRLLTRQMQSLAPLLQRLDQLAARNI